MASNPRSIASKEPSPPIAIPGSQPSTCLDYKWYPHIFSMIIVAADIPALLILRATCRGLRAEVDTKRFATHIIVEEGVPRCRNARISLNDRPELVKFVRHADFCGCYCARMCRCSECTIASCECFKIFTRPLEVLAPGYTLKLDTVRIFISTYPRPLLGWGFEGFETIVRAKTTVYIVEVFKEGTSKIIIPLNPVGGSNTVILNVRYDPENASFHNTLLEPFSLERNAPRAASYHVVITPGRPTPSFPEAPQGLKWIEAGDRHVNLLLGRFIHNLLETMAWTSALSFWNNGRCSEVVIIGYDGWPRKWLTDETGSTSDRHDKNWTKKEAQASWSKTLSRIRKAHYLRVTPEKLAKVVTEAESKLKLMTLQEYDECVESK